MEQSYETFIQHLKKKGHVLTPQRRIIFQVFLEAPSHISVKGMLARVQSVAPEVGQATVYRTMRLLVESGVAREVKFDDGVMRYEFDLGKDHHDHIVCTRCRKSVEVMDQRIENLQEMLAKMHGFKMTGHKMVLYGMCEACRTELADSPADVDGAAGTVYTSASPEYTSSQ